MKAKRAILLLISLTAAVFLFSQEGREVIIQLEFDQIDQVAINTCPLRYNKDFAFSFTFDDGLDDTYTLASKFLGGGYSPVDNINYPGFFFTDGCGKRIPFTAGVSWYTANSNGTDLHAGNGVSGYMSYNQSMELYSKDWDFFNHSYNHDANNPGIDYIWQWQRNQEIYFSQTGLDLRYFVPPSGDTNYINPAFRQGALAVFTSNQNYSGAGMGTRVDLPLHGQRAVFSRHFIASGKYNVEELTSIFSQWTAALTTDNHLWWNEFTHRVRDDEYGGSMTFADFNTYISYIMDRHGADGSDNGWFASAAQVYDYLLTRDLVTISHTKSANTLQIKIDYSQVPWNLRYYDLSLLVGTRQMITGALVLSGNAAISFASKEEGYLLNINLIQGLFAGIDIDTTPGTSDPLRIYPNPTSGPVFARSQTSPPEKLHYQLRNCTTGQVISNDSGNYSSVYHIDLSELQITPGVYLLIETDMKGQRRFARIMYHPVNH